jgi:hypothetical protein
MAKILRDHNNCCAIIERLNKNFKYMAFSYYYVSVPTVDLTLIAAMLDTNVINKVLSVLMVLIEISLLFILHIIHS